MRAVDALFVSNASANSAPKALSGGYYMLAGVATWSAGNIEVQMLGPDGSTYLSLPTPLKLTANGCIAGYLSPGTYQLVVTTATAVYARLVRVPGE